MKNIYLVPDFYKDFICKCGDCRLSCCEGWTVSVSRDEYFELISTECQAELRRKLDMAFYIPHDATPERYALLNHNYLGDCPLRQADGLCELQRTLGAGALPAVCRKYPRSVDMERGEATLANSCEGLLESLLYRTEPITFVETELDEPEPTGRETQERMDMRMCCIARVQDRRLTLRYRIAAVGDLLGVPHPKALHFTERLSVLLALAALYEEISPGLHTCCRNAYSALEGCSSADYARLSKQYDALFSHTSPFTEHVTVNHMFYEKFPYTAQNVRVSDAFASLCGLYGLMRLLCVGNIRNLTNVDAWIDIVSEIFRVAEHTHFDHNVDVLLRQLGDTSADADLMLLF